MKTLDMMLMAKGTSKTYKTEDLYYNELRGFTDCDGVPWMSASFDFINDVFEITDWEEVVEFEFEVEEVAILKSINQNFRFIVRDSYGDLEVYEHCPQRGLELWFGENSWKRERLSIFNHLFQFISWNDDPFQIDSILGYERGEK